MRRILLITAGLVALGLGVMGIFLPLLPTVPFVLLSAFCFAQSSERLHQWLLNHRMFGEIIRNFEAGKGVPRRVKVRAISLIALSMTISGWIVGRPMVWGILAVTGIAVSAYLWHMPEPDAESDHGL